MAMDFKVPRNLYERFPKKINQSLTNQSNSFTYTLSINYKSPNVKTGKTKSKETKAETLSHRHVRKPTWCWLKVPPPKCHLTIW